MTIAEDGIYETKYSDGKKCLSMVDNGITYYPCPISSIACKNIAITNCGLFCMDKKFSTIMDNKQWIRDYNKLSRSRKKADKLLNDKMKENKVYCFGDEE